MTSEAELFARIKLARLMEPSDMPGLALIAHLGAELALDVIESRSQSLPEIEHQVSELLKDNGIRSWSGLGDALGRWRPRLKDAEPCRDLEIMAKLGGTAIVPGHQNWPEAFDDLELRAPIALWVRGQQQRIPEIGQCIALVGSRDSTNYGANIATNFAAELAAQGFTVMSGGAYGIDAHAHRGALNGSADRASQDASVPTIAVMAGGLDRFYPSGNEDLLRSVMEVGCLISEISPGGNPTRYRFLQRNRLIAALSSAVVVVEARWRSGALNTAHHADELSRAVAAVPGSVFSANSAGCHRLLREGSATCVTDAAEVAELAGIAGSNLAPEPQSASAPHDNLELNDLLLLDALPLRSDTTVEKLMIVAGLQSTTVLAGLGRLQLRGLAQRNAAGWRRTKNSTKDQ